MVSWASLYSKVKVSHFTDITSFYSYNQSWVAITAILSLHKQNILQTTGEYACLNQKR